MASKQDRKVVFSNNDDIDIANKQASGGISQAVIKQQEKHSLDTDEEDNEQILWKMADEDIEGQGDSTVYFVDGIKVTPFNLKEK